MTTQVLPEEWVDELENLTDAVKQAARDVTSRSARLLVDMYYTHQKHRTRMARQAAAMHENGERPETVEWVQAQEAHIERSIKRLLQAYAEASPVGQWSLSITGIGPVIAAGLLAFIDIEKAPTVGHIWRYAGLDPTVTWGKGEKTPWNARLKTLCWKIGDSFVKQSGRDTCFYGHLYRDRKALEVERNEAGAFSDQAAAALTEKRWASDNETRRAYEAGRLPDGRIDLRARRYAVKLFLAHWHHVAYVVRYGEDPPKPYVVSHLGHAHMIAPPNWPTE